MYKIDHLYPNQVAAALEDIIPSDLKAKDIVFVCVGTDRSTGDSLGPLVGTKLKELGYNVVGTINDPCHAQTIEECTAKIPKKKYVIAIDACLGQVNSVGNLLVKNEPLKPGAGVGKDLPPVGDMHIGGVVNVGGFMEYFVLQNTRLSLVMAMAESIVESIKLRYPKRKPRKLKVFQLV